MTAEAFALLAGARRTGTAKAPRDPYAGPLPCPTEDAALQIVRKERERKKQAERNAIPMIPNA
jgi:hypothetical protein